jgi:hypothetical protein
MLSEQYAPQPGLPSKFKYTDANVTVTVPVAVAGRDSVIATPAVDDTTEPGWSPLPVTSIASSPLTIPDELVTMIVDKPLVVVAVVVTNVGITAPPVMVLAVP